MHAAFFRLLLMLLLLCIVFLMPSLLLYFLGYIPIHNFNRDDVETNCTAADMVFLQKKCSCHCYTICYRVGKYTSCTQHCSQCDCYYVQEILHVKKIDGSIFAYAMIYGGDNAFYLEKPVAEQKLLEAKKYLNATYTCFYDDKVNPVKVLWQEESDKGFFIATAVVGGIGAFCYLIHICLELYWLWLYREENNNDTEMK